MTHEQKKSRQRKSQLLEVKQTDPFTFLVQSQSDPEMFHKVTLNGHSSCSCLDWRRNHEDDPAWACKHIAAALDLKAQVERVELQQADQVNGAGLSQKERIELEAAAMFGDQTAIDTLNALHRATKEQASAPQVEMPSAAEEIPQKEICSECGAPIDPEAMKNFGAKGLICGGCLRKAQMAALNAPVSEPLDPCSLCGALLPASELLPWDGADGSGLICQECHGEIEATAEAAEIRAANETFRQRWETSQSKAATAVPSLAERIDQVNELLSSFGAVAIESDQKGFTGYGAQYVLDAVNAAMGPDGWKYDLVNHQLEKVGDKSTRAMVMIQLSLKQDNGSWFCHGPQFGGGQSSDPADALKSALTDALKKALSHWGIGNRAYRGELKASKAGKAA